MQELLGRRIEAIKLSPCDSYLSFETDTGPVQYVVEGDCCSSSYFNDLVGVQAVLGSTVTRVEDIPMPDVGDGAGNFDEKVQLYGIKVTTTSGVLDVVFRNESNGYYGGWCQAAALRDTTNWQQLTQDWPL